MDGKKYESAIADACSALSSYYYLAGEDLTAYEPVKRGVALGLAIAFGADPQSVEYDMDNYRG